MEEQKDLITYRELLGHPPEYEPEGTPDDLIELSLKELLNEFFDKRIAVRFTEKLSDRDRYEILLDLLDQTIDIETYRWTIEMHDHLEVIIGKEFVKPTETRVHELIGSPEIIPADKLNELDAAREIHNLRRLFSKHNITVECFSDISRLELYRFITETVLPATVVIDSDDEEDILFTYESYQEQDRLTTAENVLIGFILSMREHEWEKAYHYFSENGVRGLGGKKRSKEDVIQNIQTVKADYSTLTTREFTITHSSLKEQNVALLEVEVQWTHSNSPLKWKTIEEAVRVEVTLDPSITDDQDDYTSPMSMWRITGIESRTLLI